MLRSPIYQDDYRPQLSGHETFPIRYGWLKKAFDRVWNTEDQGDNREGFSGSDAIARFGVGKNMVSSMRHWAKATGMIKDAPGANGLTTTSLGHLVFGDPGLDPYMEHPATAWLLHWNLCSRSERTTWYWVFPPLLVRLLRARGLGPRPREVGRRPEVEPRFHRHHSKRCLLFHPHVCSSSALRPRKLRRWPGIASD